MAYLASQFEKRELGRLNTKLIALCVAILPGGCTTFNQPANTPVDSSSNPMAQLTTPDVGDDTAIALAFSGGGMRAAAFAYGVLRGLDRLPTKDGKSYLDRVVFVSGVSGGSVTAAYFGLKVRAALADFRERFLIRNAEEDLNTDYEHPGFGAASRRENRRVTS